MKKQTQLVLKNGKFLPGLDHVAVFESLTEARGFAKVYCKRGTYTFVTK